eukprot:792081-Alexandrium_andersonii.AAC.1
MCCAPWLAASSEPPALLQRLSSESSGKASGGQAVPPALPHTPMGGGHPQLQPCGSGRGEHRILKEAGPSSRLH